MRTLQRITPTLRRVALAAAAGLLLGAGPSQAQIAPGEALELVQAAGHDRLSDVAALQLKLSLPDMLETRGHRLAPALREQLLQRAEARFTGPALRDALVRELAPRVAAADVQAVKLGLADPAARAVLAAYVEGHAKAHDMSADPEAPGRAWHNAGVARQNLIDDVVEAMGEAELVVQSYLRTPLAMRRALQRLDGSPFMESEEELARAVASPAGLSMNDLRRQMHFSLRNQAALHLRELPDATLAQWLAFVRTPAYQRFRSALQEALLARDAAALESLARP